MQTHEGTYRSWLEDRIRVDLALAPQGWEPVQMSWAPKARPTTDAFQATDWRPTTQPSMVMSNASHHMESKATAVNLQGAFHAVVSLLLGAAIVLLLVLAYQADTR